MSLTFLTPLILAGGVLTAVPIIVHLIMRRKPKHLLFPAFRFLEQKQRTNVRKLRLRHLLLLTLRVLLILFICGALARPQLTGGLGTLDIDRPVSLVMVFDTSASMGYESSGKSRLEEAGELALSVVEELPGGSQIAVVDTARTEFQFQSPEKAGERIGSLSVRPDNRSVTTCLQEVYSLLESVDPEELMESVAICVFSDRTTASWDQGSVTSYVLPGKARAESKLGRPVHGVYVDVGAEEPANVTISQLLLRLGDEDTVTAIEDLTQGLSAARPVRAQIQAFVKCAGADVDTEISLFLDGQELDTKRLSISAEPGQSNSEIVTFRSIELNSPVHQGTVRMRSADALRADNQRFWSVALPNRRAVVIADEPNHGHFWDTFLLNEGVESEVLNPEQSVDAIRSRRHDLICLVNVGRPSDDLWRLLEKHTQEGGGLLLLPGDRAEVEFYNNDAAQRVMPGKLVEIHRPGRPGSFLDLSDTNHAIAARFKSWAEQGTDLSVGRAYQYWAVEPAPAHALTILTYNDGRPALTERSRPRPPGGSATGEASAGGRVILFSTAMYRTDDRNGVDWNNYLSEWFGYGLALETTRYAIGSIEEKINFQFGERPTYRLPNDLLENAYLLSGPSPASGKLKTGQNSLRIVDAAEPGNFELTAGETWSRRFSMNLPASETDLLSGRPGMEQIAELFGEANTYVPLEEENNLLSMIRTQLGQSPRLDMLPWLMIGVLMVLAGESFLANRFYKSE